MVKSSSGLFGSLRPGAVTIVDAPVSRAYARKARITFYAVTIATLLTTGVVVRHWPATEAVGISFGAAIIAGLLAAVAVVVWPAVRVLWHWSLEIAAGLALLAGWAVLSDATSNLWAALILAAIAGGLFGWPASRCRVRGFVRCAITRHRLRHSFAQFIRATGRTHHHAGSLPLILLARPTPAGERVWVWLRPGLALAALEDKTDELAVACWASLVRVTPASERHAALVRIDVARRDPLAGKVSYPLAAAVPSQRNDTGTREDAAPVSPGMPPLAPLGLDLDEVPAPPPPKLADRSGRR